MWQCGRCEVLRLVSVWFDLLCSPSLEQSLCPLSGLMRVRDSSRLSVLAYVRYCGSRSWSRWLCSYLGARLVSRVSTWGKVLRDFLS